MEVINSYVRRLFGYDLRYREQWSTDVVDYDTGLEQRNQIWPRPKRHWVLPYQVMREEYRTNLIKLFRRAHGKFRVFLFKDPYDEECALTECSITAVAAQVDFQLIKSYYPDEAETWSENKTRIQPGNIFPPVIKVDNVTQMEDVDFTLDDDTGIITFSSAPGAGAVVTANYKFYCPVRFNTDIYEESTIYQAILDLGELPIIEVIE